MSMSCEERRKILDSANGKVFSCTFMKKDGTVREIVAKKWMRKSFANGVEAVGKNTVESRPEYYTCAEVSSGTFKNVNLNTLISAKVNGVLYKFD